MVLLAKVYELVENEGLQVGNLDAVIQAEEPKLKEYKNQMKFHIAYKLAVPEEKINIKATTMEGIGAIGKKEGIAAYVTVLLEKK